MNICKSPGQDFPIEWLKTFSNLLITKLHQVYNGMYENGALTFSLCHVYTMVIPKPGKDHAQHANVGP